MSEHFSLEELTATSHRDLDNTPGPGVVIALRDTAQRMETVRDLLGGLPIHVNSGYRSPAVNIAVGGTANSAHMTGHAVDFICPGFGSPLSICRHLAARMLERDGPGAGFDQIIEEGRWVHISFAPTMRGQVMTKGPVVDGKQTYRKGLD